VRNLNYQLFVKDVKLKLLRFYARGDLWDFSFFPDDCLENSSLLEGPAIGHLDTSLLVILLTSRKLLYGFIFPDCCSMVLTQLSQFKFAKLYLPV